MTDERDEKNELSGQDGDQFVGKRNPQDANEGDAEAAMLAMLEGQSVGDGELEEKLAALPLGEKVLPENIKYEQRVARPADFQQLSGDKSSTTKRSIDMLLDVNLPISIELGRTKMTILDILALGPGSVVELNKLAGEPVEVLVNQRTIAMGEVVVVDENFGVRITQLVSPEDRVKSLQERVE